MNHWFVIYTVNRVNFNVHSFERLDEASDFLDQKNPADAIIVTQQDFDRFCVSRCYQDAVSDEIRKIEGELEAKCS